MRRLALLALLPATAWAMPPRDVDHGPPPKDNKPVQQVEDVVTDAMPRGLLVGARLESDVLSYDLGFAAVPSLVAIWAGRDFGAALSLIGARPLGVRADGRFYVLSQTPYRPYITAGLELFVPDLGARGGAGIDWKIGPVVAFGEVTVDYFMKREPDFRPTALVVSLGAGYDLL